MTDAAEHVPDQPCPKCGHDDVRLEYCKGHAIRGGYDICRWNEPEHFHRQCLRCGYWWRTDDVIKIGGER